MKNLSIPLSLLLLLSLLGGATAAAQSSVTVVRQGDLIPGVGNVTIISHFRVNNDGDWILKVRTDNPNPDRDEAIVRNGVLMIQEGDPAPGLVGATFSQFRDFDVNDGGDVAAHVFVAGLAAGETGAIYYKGQPLLVQGDLVGAAGFAAGATYHAFYNVHLNDSNQLLVFMTVSEGPDFVVALLRYEFDALGNLVSETLLTRSGIVPVGQTFAIEGMPSGFGSYSLNDNGGGVWSAVLDSAAAPNQYVTYFNTATLVAQSATPSPVPGRDWADELSSIPGDSNASGSWVIRAKLDSSDTTNDGLILLDGSVYVREGDPFPSLPGSDIVGLAGEVYLTEAGEVLYQCQLDGVVPSVNEALMLGSTIVAWKGMTSTFDGHLVTALRAEFVASDDGDFLMYVAVLDGTDEAVLLVERNIGVDYCSAELNSTGGTSFIVPSGSTDVGFNSLRLRTFNLPADQFGYYLASMTQADILHPGGSQGRLCLGGTIGRFATQVQNSGASGSFGIQVDLTAIPTTPTVAVQPGETWNLQTWHRDNNPNSTSNFSLPVSITFR